MTPGAGRILAVLATFLPIAVVCALVSAMVLVCMPTSQVDCPLAGLEGAARGLAFISVMLVAGGLLAFAFSNLDRALGIDTACNDNGNHKEPS